MLIREEGKRIFEVTSMAWKYNVGLLLIASVVFIWVTSAEVTQSIFKAYKHPFAITYMGVSLMIVYLPLSLLKDWIYLCIKNHYKSRKKTLESVPETGCIKGSCLQSPLKATGLLKGIDTEMQHFTAQKGLGLELSDEEGRPLIKRSAWNVAKTSFCIAPLWFSTEYFSNAALAQTSVASTTVLSSTSGLFTLFFGALLGQDSLDISKIIAVFVSIMGVVMTTLGKTWAADDPQLPSVGASQHSILGDVLGLLSAFSYGLFTVLLKKFAGKGGETMDVQKVFGYIGLFTLLALWWLVWPLTALGLESKFSIPTSAKLDEVLIANGFIGSVVSDYFWALSVVWTTPLIATLGMSLTIPLAMVADILVHGRHFSAIYVLGSVQVFAGFVVANLSEHCSQKFGF